MSGEAALMSMLQVELQSMTNFASGSVVINDWSIFDQSSAKAPYALIEGSNSLEVEMLQLGQSNTIWEIGVTLIVKFSNWKPSLDAFTTLRDAVVTHFRNALLEANGTLEFSLRSMRNETDIYGIYDRYVDEKPEALPVFLAQKLLFSVSEIELN